MFSILPRDTAFFDLFEKAAKIVNRSAQAYSDLVRDFPNRAEHIARIRQFEHDNDEIVHQTLQRLDTTFITPFDREDIHALMKHMDDVIDEIDAASKRFTIYKIQAPTTWLTKQTDILVRATSLLTEAVHRLRDFGKNNGVHEKLVEIHRLENQGDENNHAAVAELFEQNTEPLLVIKLKEIYDFTERAIDRCEDIADIIEAILLKNG